MYSPSFLDKDFNCRNIFISDPRCPSEELQHLNNDYFLAFKLCYLWLPDDSCFQQEQRSLKVINFLKLNFCQGVYHSVPENGKPAMWHFQKAGVGQRCLSICYGASLTTLAVVKTAKRHGKKNRRQCVIHCCSEARDLEKPSHPDLHCITIPERSSKYAFTQQYSTF